MRIVQMMQSMIVVSILFLGCASEKINVVALPEGADPSQEIEKLSSALNQGRVDQMDYLSPNAFSKAEDRISEAKKHRSETAPNSDILKNVAEGQAFLSRAKERSDVSRIILKDVQLARHDALQSGAVKYFRPEILESDAQFLDMARSIENGKTMIPESDFNQLLRQYRDLELKSVRETYLGEPAKQLSQAQLEGAEQWAPKTLMDSQKAVSNLETKIDRDPKNRVQLEELSHIAKQKTARLLQVTRQAKLVETRNPEETALQMEGQKKEISDLGKEAMTQEESLRQQDEAMKQKEEQISSLEAEKEVNERFKRARAYFTPEEADVFRTDHKIVIRLKGLKFAVAGAEILSENFTLLSKAEKAIAEFGKDNKIIIEGHADASGSKKKNEQLSLKRAQSVRDYFASSEVIAPQKIEAMGKGISEPIASNTTPKGRALNRRVDIVIESLPG